MQKKSTAKSKRGSPHLQKPRARREATQLRLVIALLQEQREATYLRIIGVLHDDVLSRLVGVRLDLEEIGGRVGRPRSGHDRRWNDATQGIKDVIRAAARLRAELRPPLLEHCGLEAAIGSSVAAWEMRFGLRCRFTASVGALQIPPPLMLELFRSFEDSLSSLIQICERSPLEIELGKSRGSYRLSVGGRVSSASAANKLIGSPILLAMRERARRLGGSLRAHRTPAPEVTLVFAIPG